ncbi:hypothetical protein Hsar01_02153 [Haloferula sargassicola]|uniref:DUF4190 domain-containing protein n=2 Tax=Haloferula sargassicola TaxID=490096 RepID=A0ABP9UQC7_9BACT
MALASLICGIAGLVTCGVSSLVGVILGHLALSDIKKTGKDGRGLAVAGLVTSYVLMVLVGISALAGLAAPMILRQKQAAERTLVITNMKRISMHLIEFDVEYGSYPNRETKELVQTETEVTLPIDGIHPFEQLEAAGVEDLTTVLTVPKMAAGEWIYYSYEGGTPAADRPVLVSPAVGRKRLVLSADASVESIPADVGLPASDGEMEEIPAPRK